MQTQKEFEVVAYTRYGFEAETVFASDAAHAIELASKTLQKRCGQNKVHSFIAEEIEFLDQLH